MFSRESRTKPSFATVTGKGDNPTNISLSQKVIILFEDTTNLQDLLGGPFQVGFCLMFLAAALLVLFIPTHSSSSLQCGTSRSSPGSVAIGMTRFGDKHLFSLANLRTRFRWLRMAERSRRKRQAPLEEADDVDI